MNGKVITVILKPIEQKSSAQSNSVLRLINDGVLPYQYAVTVSGSEINGAISRLSLVFCDGNKICKRKITGDPLFVKLNSLPENFSACVYKEDFSPIFYGTHGKPLLNAEGLMRYAKTDFEDETEIDAQAWQEVYDDDAIAEYDYYQKERRLNNAGEAFHYADAKKEDFKHGKTQRDDEETRSDEAHAFTRDDKDGKNGDFTARAEGRGVFETVESGQKIRRSKFLTLFLSGERVFDFKRTMPFLRLAKLSTNGKTILIGEAEISNESYYAYGVYGKKNNPPESFSGKEWFYIPTDFFDKNAVGAYMIFNKKQ